LGYCRSYYCCSNYNGNLLNNIGILNKLISLIRASPIDGALLILIPCLYSVNNAIFKKIANGYLYSFFNFYFNDLICPLFLLAYSNILLLTVGKGIRRLHLILLFLFFCGAFWEFISPKFIKSSVADCNDMLFYICGGFVYWIIFRWKKYTNSTFAHKK
jgi:hypothetical protein